MDLIFDTRKGGENALKNGKEEYLENLRRYHPVAWIVFGALCSNKAEDGGGKEVEGTKSIDIIKY